mgnify:CR=1 FL=1
MRLAVFVASICISSSALADPISESKALYIELASLGPVLIDLVGTSDGDAETVAKKIETEIVSPVGEATQRWMDAAFNGEGSADSYRPYASCLEAATALQDLASHYQRYLRGRDLAPPRSEAAQPFVTGIDACAVALGLPASGLSE